MRIAPGPNQILVQSERGMARKNSKNSQESFLRSHQIDQKCRQNILESYVRNIARHFFATNISCRIYILKNAILWVNSWDTSLQLLLLLSVCYFCPLLGSIHMVWSHSKINSLFYIAIVTATNWEIAQFCRFCQKLLAVLNNWTYRKLNKISGF